VRAAQARGKITPAGLASWKQTSKSSPRRFPVTVTQMPVTRCEICHHTVTYRPGSLIEVLTEHYRRAPSRSARHPFPVALRRLPHYTADTVIGAVWQDDLIAGA
jgi:hypothetical protein